MSGTKSSTCMMHHGVCICHGASMKVCVCVVLQWDLAGPTFAFCFALLALLALLCFALLCFALLALLRVCCASRASCASCASSAQGSFLERGTLCRADRLALYYCFLVVFFTLLSLLLTLSFVMRWRRRRSRRRKSRNRRIR